MSPRLHVSSRLFPRGADASSNYYLIAILLIIQAKCKTLISEEKPVRFDTPTELEDLLRLDHTIRVSIIIERIENGMQ